MKIPPYLKRGDTIALAAPARFITKEELDFAITFLESQGFRIILAENLFLQQNQFAGNDTVRTVAFQKLIDNPEVKAILCVRGGYGSVRIIDQLDFSSFKNNPKWICGYSDVTVFHSHLNAQYQIATLHSTMPISMSTEAAENNYSLCHLLKGEKMQYSIPAHTLNRNGSVEGELVGGNLSILYSLLGTSSDLSLKGKILLIEDIEEYLYHIDRMIVSLERTGKLADISGLIVGGMSKMNDNTIPFGKNAEEIIAEHCAKYSFPIVFNFPVGHTAQNIALKLGSKIRLKVSNICTLNEL